MRKEMKYLIGGLVFGFAFFFILLALVANVYASEVDELPESENHEIVQDVQENTEESSRSEALEDQKLVKDEQIDLTAMIPADQLEMLDNWAQELEVDENEGSHIEPFASGVIVGELADLLQNNVIENDGYTDESWQRYELAVAAGWDAISNFMIYTNDEVRAVIDELQAAISGLEYPAGKPPDIGNVGLEVEYMIALLCALGLIFGSVLGLSFMTKFQMGV